MRAAGCGSTRVATQGTESESKTHRLTRATTNDTRCATKTSNRNPLHKDAITCNTHGEQLLKSCHRARSAGDKPRCTPHRADCGRTSYNNRPRTWISNLRGGLALPLLRYELTRRVEHPPPEHKGPSPDWTTVLASGTELVEKNGWVAFGRAHLFNKPRPKRTRAATTLHPHDMPHPNTCTSACCAPPTQAPHAVVRRAPPRRAAATHARRAPRRDARCPLPYENMSGARASHPDCSGHARAPRAVLRLGVARSQHPARSGRPRAGARLVRARALSARATRAAVRAHSLASLAREPRDNSRNGAGRARE